jgi:hypothetical protein
MKPSLQPTPPSRLPESIHRQLNMYSLAASAAGVGALALMPQSAAARIVYTPTHHIIGEESSYVLALNHKTPDFVISNTRCHQGTSRGSCQSAYWASLNVAEASNPWAGNEVEGTIGNSYLAAALKRGARISGAQRFIRGAAMVSQCVGDCATSTRTVGPWRDVTNRYLGLKLKINGRTHYGWARLSVSVKSFKITATLTGYAYETIANKPIRAGQEHDAEPLTEPATLGRLALGKK